MQEQRRSSCFVSPTALILAAVWILCLAAFADQVSASTFKKAQRYHLSNIETINDDLYVYANNMTIEGLVFGDLAAFAYQATVEGQVSQSAMIFARQVDQSGKIDGSFRAFAEFAKIDGYIGRSVVIGARDLQITKNAMIERDAAIFASQANIEGVIKGNVVMKAGAVDISGKNKVTSVRGTPEPTINGGPPVGRPGKM